MKSQENDLSFGQTLTKFNLTNFIDINRSTVSKRMNENAFPQQIYKKIINNRSSPHTKINIQKRNIPCFGTVDIQNIKRKRKGKSKSQMKIQVTSKSQKSLIQFINPQNLPEILIKNRLKKSPIQRLIKIANNEDKFRKFTLTYFRSLQKTKKKLEQRIIKQQFPEVKALGWSVKGYLINQNLILKAIRYEKDKNMFSKRKIQKYKKFYYNERIKEKVSQNYPGFVKEWLYIDQVLLK